MGEFEDLFGQPAPAATVVVEPQVVTIDVTGQDAAALDAFCQCLAMMAAASDQAQTAALWPGLQALQSVWWQVQTGLGLAASGLGWTATFQDFPLAGQKLLSFRRHDQELHVQIDGAGQFFLATWQSTADAGGFGTLTFSIDPGPGGSSFHARTPMEFSLPLGAQLPGWTVTPQIAEQPPAPGADGGPTLTGAGLAPRPRPAPPPARPTIERPMPQPPVVPGPPPVVAAPPVVEAPPVAAAAEPAAPQGVWSVTLRTGPDVGKKFVLRDRKRIGRAADSDIVLSDDAASRNHAVIEVTEAGCTITDLGSTNGTQVNGEPVHGSTMLNHGDLITCGQTEMLVSGPPRPDPGMQKTRMISIRDIPLPPPPATRPIAPEPPAAPAGTPFCQFCGKPLTGTPMFCAYCGHQLR